MGKETKMSMVEMLIIVFIFILMILVPIFLAMLLSKLSINIEDNALRRASTEIAENLLYSDIAHDSSFILDKLNVLDKAETEPIQHCYAYYVSIRSFEKINDKDVWRFGYKGNEENFEVELPVSIDTGTSIVPAKLSLTVYDTNAKRCPAKS